MARPRFSEMLVERRRQLGLTVAQASRVLRIKEQALIALEEGDFDVIPKSGYAQGMLSSYARYLGLNPREVVDQFTDDLYDHERGTSARSLSHDVRNARRDGRRMPSDEAIYELPNTTTSSPQSPTRRYGADSGTASAYSGQSTALVRRSNQQPLAGGRTHIPSFQERDPHRYDERVSYGPAERTDSGRYATDRTQGRGPADRSYPQGRPYTSRDMSSRSSSRDADRSRQQQGRPRRQDGQSRDYRQQQPRDARARDSYARDEITTRSVRPREYRDDLRYDDDARPYEAASTQTGRRSSRNIATPERPNVRRRPSGSNQRQVRDRGRNRKPTRGGLIGVIQAFFSDSRRTMVTILVALVVILVLIISFSVRSCTASGTSTSKQVSVSASTATTATASTTTSDQEATDAALSQAAAKSAAAAAAAASQETDVKVSVADGQVTWVEIQCDGESKVAQTITGAWDQTYVVTDSITIQVGDTTAVTVTKNGEQVQFDSSSAGVNSVTIQGTAVASTTDATATTEETTSE